jgi:membrane-anchored protein YejM (alkaline phosphatase superfamily)
LINLIFSLIITWRFYQVQPMPSTFIGQIFGCCHAIGHIGLISFILATPLFLLNFCKQKTKVILLIAILISSLGLIALVADTFVYQLYRFHINAMVLELFIVGGSEVITFPISMWIKIVSLMIIILAVQFFIAKFIARYVRFTHSTPKAIFWVVPICLLSANIIHVWADGTFYKDITMQDSYLPLAQPVTAKKLMAKYGLLNVDAYKQQALLKQNKNSGELTYSIAKISHPTIKQKMNVVFIIIDSWRADMMNEVITPNIAGFAENSSQFNNHFSGSNNTRHGMFSLFYGLPGSYWKPILQQQTAPILIDTFLEQGYQAKIFASAKLTMPEFDQTLFSSVKDLRTNSRGATPWQRDLNATQDMLVSDLTSKPTLSVLFLDSAHGFSLPKAFNKLFTPSLESINYMDLHDEYDVEPFLNLYKNSLYFVDQQVGKVLSAISKDLDNTIVIITSDHGEEFNDNKKGYWGHNSNYSPYQTRVPFIMHWPGKELINTQKQTSHFDVVPTIMEELFKVENPAQDYSSGQSLLTEIERESIILGRNGYYAINDSKYIYELNRYGNFSIFNENYEVENSVLPNVKEIQKAIQEMSRFYKTQHN